MGGIGHRVGGLVEGILWGFLVGGLWGVLEGILWGSFSGVLWGILGGVLMGIISFLVFFGPTYYFQLLPHVHWFFDAL